MSTHAKTKNRQIRQDALREQLAAKGLMQQVIESLDKIENLAGDTESDKFDLQKYKVANELRLRLVNKYLPDLKQQDITLGGDPDNPVSVVGRNMTPEEAHDAYLKALEG